MKRLLFIGALFIWSMACTNHEEKSDSTVLPPATTGNAGDTAGRLDTASYERMPQQTTDTTKK